MGWSKDDKSANNPKRQHDGGKKNPSSKNIPGKDSKKNDPEEFKANPDPFYEGWKESNRPKEEE